MPSPSTPRSRSVVSARYWALMKPVQRVAAKLRGGRIHQYERVDPQGRPAAPWFSPGHLLRWKKRIPALSYPPTVPASELGLRPEELVLAAERGGEARLYPTSTLRVHHIVNDLLGGSPFCITFCLKCFSGVAFDPRAAGRTLTFELFGMYEGAAVMRDEQTGTLWPHLTGEAMLGPLVGHRLPLLPVHMTTAARWLERYPHTVAPDPEVMVAPVVKRPGESGLDAEFRSTVSRWDDRLPARTYVLGVAAGGSARAYVMDPGAPGPRLHQDELGGVPIALLAERGTFPLAYDRRTDDGVVELRAEGERIVDRTGSEWTGDGRALDGPMAGTVLRFVPSHLSEWYAWSAYHPDTGIARIPSTDGRSRGAD